MTKTSQSTSRHMFSRQNKRAASGQSDADDNSEQFRIAQLQIENEQLRAAAAAANQRAAQQKPELPAPAHEDNDGNDLRAPEHRDGADDDLDECAPEVPVRRSSRAASNAVTNASWQHDPHAHQHHQHHVQQQQQPQPHHHRAPPPPPPLLTDEPGRTGVTAQRAAGRVLRPSRPPPLPPPMARAGLQQTAPPQQVQEQQREVDQLQSQVAQGPDKRTRARSQPPKDIWSPSSSLSAASSSTETGDQQPVEGRRNLLDEDSPALSSTSAQVSAADTVVERHLLAGDSNQPPPPASFGADEVARTEPAGGAAAEAAGPDAKLSTMQKRWAPLLGDRRAGVMAAVGGRSFSVAAPDGSDAAKAIAAAVAAANRASVGPATAADLLRQRRGLAPEAGAWQSPTERYWTLPSGERDESAHRRGSKTAAAALRDESAAAAAQQQKPLGASRRLLASEGELASASAAVAEVGAEALPRSADRSKATPLADTVENSDFDQNIEADGKAGKAAAAPIDDKKLTSVTNQQQQQQQQAETSGVATGVASGSGKQTADLAMAIGGQSVVGDGKQTQPQSNTTNKEEWFKQMYRQMHRPAASSERNRILEAVNAPQPNDTSLIKIKLKSPKTGKRLVRRLSIESIAQNTNSTSAFTHRPPL